MNIVNMKRLLIIAAALAVLSGCGSNEGPQTDEGAPERKGWYGPDLYGDVESVTIKMYELNTKFGEETLGELESSDKYDFNESGDVIRQVSTYYFSSGDPWGYASVNVYDDERNLIEMTTYNYEGEVSGKYIYDYDEDGNCLARTYYDDDGELETKYLWTYNDKGKYIDRKDYDAKGNWVKQYVPEYDDTGNNVCKCTYGANGELINKQLRKYDDEDRCVELKEIEYKLSPGSVASIDMVVADTCEFTTGVEEHVTLWYKWVCDDKGKVVEVREFAPDGVEKGKSVNSYKDGHLSEVIEYDSLGVMVAKLIYLRDQHGNVIERKDYEYKGPIEFSKQKVIYEIEYR